MISDCNVSSGDAGMIVGLAVAAAGAFSHHPLPPPTKVTSVARSAILTVGVEPLAESLQCWKACGGAILERRDERSAGRATSQRASLVLSAAPSLELSPETLDLIDRADAMHASNDVDGVFALLENANTSIDELAWRVARAHHDKAEDGAEAARDAGLKEKLLRDGLAVAESAKAASGSGYALKWYAILLGRLGDFLSTKEKVGNSYKIKEALEAAAGLLPQDASIQTALGQWCYKVASISWIERNVAKALFGAPPESSYAEALGFVTRSHEIRPSKKAVSHREDANPERSP